MIFFVGVGRFGGSALKISAMIRMYSKQVVSVHSLGYLAHHHGTNLLEKQGFFLLGLHDTKQRWYETMRWSTSNNNVCITLVPVIDNAKFWRQFGLRHLWPIYLARDLNTCGSRNQMSEFSIPLLFGLLFWACQNRMLTALEYIFFLQAKVSRAPMRVQKPRRRRTNNAMLVLFVG